MGLFDDIKNLVTGDSTPAAPAQPTVVVVQPQAAPTPGAVPTPAQAAPHAFSGHSVTENNVWVDPLTMKQWLGIFDSNGFFVKLEAATTPSTSEAMLPGHAYQINPHDDGSFDVLADLGKRSALSGGGSGGSAQLGAAVGAAHGAPAPYGAPPAYGSPYPAGYVNPDAGPAPAQGDTTENVMWVDVKGKQWAGHLVNNKFAAVEPMYHQTKGKYQWGHAYQLSGQVVGKDLGWKAQAQASKTAGGFVDDVMGFFKGKMASTATTESVLYVDVAPTQLPAAADGTPGELVYAWAGKFGPTGFTRLEPAGSIVVSGARTTGMNQSPAGLVPGHYYRLGAGGAVGADLGTMAVKTAGGPVLDDSAMTALVGVGAVAALGLLGYAAYKAMAPSEEGMIGVLSAGKEKDLVRKGKAYARNVRFGTDVLLDDLRDYDTALSRHDYARAGRAIKAAATHVRPRTTITSNLRYARKTARQLKAG